MCSPIKIWSYCVTRFILYVKFYERCYISKAHVCMQYVELSPWHFHFQLEKLLPEAMLVRIDKIGLNKESDSSNVNSHISVHILSRG